jgi:hypothetical protein
MRKTNYQITIGYKAVICVDVVAENEKDAKEIALADFKHAMEKAFKTRNVHLQDEYYKADGILDMDATWNALNQ